MEASCIMGMASTWRHCWCRTKSYGCCRRWTMWLSSLLLWFTFFLARRCFPRLPVLAAYVVGGIAVGEVDGTLLGLLEGNVLGSTAVGTVEGCILGLIDGAGVGICSGTIEVGVVGTTTLGSARRGELVDVFEGIVLGRFHGTCLTTGGAKRVAIGSVGTGMVLGVVTLAKMSAS
eukprot:scaffold5358_cov62-Attheya_sp.AAC.3